MPACRLTLAAWMILLAVALAVPARAADEDLAVGARPVAFFPATVKTATAPGPVTGLLFLPAGKGPFPAVVLLHGCSGQGRNNLRWAGFFRDRGVAALVVDSFGPRGVKEICTDFRRVTDATRAADAFGALDYLLGLPEIRRGAVAVMGFSHGGGIALDVAGATRIGQRPAKAPRFAASLAVYPGCGRNDRQAERYLIPTHIFIGADDDWTPAAPCRALVLARQGSDQAVGITVYPEAHHGFDAPGTAKRYRPNVRNRNSPTGRGATVAGNPAALEACRADVIAFWDRVMPR